MDKPVTLATLDVVDMTTNQVLQQIIQGTEPEDSRFAFHVPRGYGAPLMTRVRVKLTRIRDKMRQHDLKMVHFRLHSEIEKCEDDPTQELITCWRERSAANVLTEIYEDMTRKGTPDAVIG